MIRKDIEDDFKERTGEHVEDIYEKIGVEITYAFQDLCILTTPYTVPVN